MIKNQFSIGIARFSSYSFIFLQGILKTSEGRSSMGRIKHRNLCLSIGLTALVLLSGCQSLQPIEKGELSLPDAEFMGLWATYNDCIVDQDPLHMKEYVLQLTDAPRPISIHHSPIPLPRFLKNWTSNRGSRLSVDPRAMAASCALQAGTTAWKTGHYILAQDLLQSIIDEYPEAEYAYYVSQARSTILQVPSFRNAALPD